MSQQPVDEERFVQFLENDLSGVHAWSEVQWAGYHIVGVAEEVKYISIVRIQAAGDIVTLHAAAMDKLAHAWLAWRAQNAERETHESAAS